MAFNPMNALKVKGMYDKFTRNHPKFPAFLSAVQNKGIKEGTIIEISFKDPDGTDLSSNVKLTAEDMQMFNELKEIIR